jgi:hypothetical protein
MVLQVLPPGACQFLAGKSRDPPRKFPKSPEFYLLIGQDLSDSIEQAFSLFTGHTNIKGQQ